MRQPSSVLRYLVILLALSFAAHAHADDRSDARAHYQAGVKFYASGDYRSAIREFSSAQQLVPADLNNYNLALCYDKLGDVEPAVQYYRAFLDKQPNTDKRAEIEASISRLEAAARSIASKKADEARRADDARRAEEARRAEDDRRAEEARPPEPPSDLGPSGSAPLPPAGASGDERKRPGPAVAGSTGTPSSGTPVPTGDSQLDRVNSINIDEIREQRVGGAGSGIADPRGPAGSANDRGMSGQLAPAPGGPSGPSGMSGPSAMGGPSGMSQNGMNGPSAMSGPSASGMDGAPLPGEQPKEKPVYKKWWFWAVVGVSAYVAIELATSSSTPARRNQGLTGGSAPPPGGLTLMRW
jgi:hypothetical protein